MMKFRWLWCLLLVVFGASSDAALKGEEPPFALTLDQIKHWSTSESFVDPKNISKVPLARRFIAPLNEKRAQLDQQARVFYAPDGLGNFAGYLETQDQFNLYNFTHWSQIDVINFFGGTATLAAQIPARPWVETAHKNGVKVLGSVFLAVAVYGGSADTVEELLMRDDEGRFIYADRLIEIANYYGFDGWLINQETDLTVVKDVNNAVIEGQQDHARAKKLAGEMLAFMKYITAKSPQGMEIHWYDSMLMDGRVVWQNELNQANQMFLHDGVRSADAVFLNYWWNKNMIKSSNRIAASLKRSPYDVFVGVDLWPSRNAQRAFSRTEWLSWLFDESGHKALGSIALFAPNLFYNFEGNEHTPAFSDFKNDPSDSSSFYQAEERLFTGDDLNLAINDTKGWPGIGRYLPARSSINSLPFSTNFSTGQGKVLIRDGQQVQNAWSNMSLQAILPTWQFAVLGNTSFNLNFDFDEVYDGGNSLRINGNPSLGDTQIPLYRTDVQLHHKSALQLVFKGEVKGASTFLEFVDGQQVVLALDDKDLSDMSSKKNWTTRNFSLTKYAGHKIVKIGMRFDTHAAQMQMMNLGKLTLR